MKLSARFKEVRYQASLDSLAYKLKIDTPSLKMLRLCSMLTSRIFEKQYFFRLKSFLGNQNTYSQYAQDIVIAKILDEKNTGVFVDIGANDGIKISNSLYFEQRGWQGVCVEANPAIAEKLKSNRNCSVFSAAAGSENGTVKFLSFEEHDMLSRISTLPINEGEEMLFSTPKQEFVVEMIRTDNILLEAKGLSESGTIDYLSIDVEGAEMEILHGIDFTKHKIKTISIENNTKSIDQRKILKKHGFLHIITLGCDDIYIHQDSTFKTQTDVDFLMLSRK